MFICRLNNIVQKVDPDDPVYFIINKLHVLYTIIQLSISPLMLTIFVRKNADILLRIC